MNPVWSRCWQGLGIALVAALSACTHTVKVEPIKVEPIDITLHIYLEADQKLDSFFSDDGAPAAPSPAPDPGDRKGGSS